jgi:hypothetical protein
MNTGRAAGHFFNALGVVTLLWMIAGPISGNSLTIDFTFILHFWIGMGLLKGRSGARKGALFVASLFVLFSIGYGVSLLWATGPVSGGGGRGLRTPLLASFHAAVLLILFMTPLVLLLLPATRRWFADMKLSPPPPYPLTRKVVASYVIASMAFIGGGIALDRSTRLAEPSGYSTSFTYGGDKLGVVAAGWMEDEATKRPLFVSWLVFAETNTYGSERDGHLSFGGILFPVSDTQPVRYLVSPPSDKGRSGNVALIRKDGTVTRLARRVTHAQLELACEAAKGSRDFDDLQGRLEAMLPSTDVAAAGR